MSPRRFFAMIFPEGSISILKGMLFTRYNCAAALFQNCRSLTWVHVRLSLWIAASQLSFPPGLSRETPKTVKFFSLNWLKFSTTLGFSALQGPHQLAQKSTRTYFPWNDERLMGVPVVSG